MADDLGMRNFLAKSVRISGEGRDAISMMRDEDVVDGDIGRLLAEWELLNRDGSAFESYQSGFGVKKLVLLHHRVP